jgi:type I pantothenate kinase
MTPKSQRSPFLSFSRKEWCQFRGNEQLTLNQRDLEKLRGQGEEISLNEVQEIYLPLSRLLSFYVMAKQNLHRSVGHFLQSEEPKVPYIIGVSGSVAVGKSLTSRVLRALLSRWPSHPRVEIITTDGFLFSNEELEKRNLMHRKGFPESYDLPNLLRVLNALKAGERNIAVPVYSHHSYNILHNEFSMIDQPDIVILEGLNLLQIGPHVTSRFEIFVSDFIDFSCFVDAKPELIQAWYIERVLKFSATAFQNPNAYFNFLTRMTKEDVVAFAKRIWHEINEVNLFENILPFRGRADLILEKEADHGVRAVLLRKL